MNRENQTKKTIQKLRHQRDAAVEALKSFDDCLTKNEVEAKLTEMADRCQIELVELQTKLDYANSSINELHAIKTQYQSNIDALQTEGFQLRQTVTTLQGQLDLKTSQLGEINAFLGSDEMRDLKKVRRRLAEAQETIKNQQAHLFEVGKEVTRLNKIVAALQKQAQPA